jgi:hypothetical protein
MNCDGSRWRTGGEVKENLANGVGSQYSSHYLGIWCIQHYYRWCAHLDCQYSTELTPPADLNGLVRFAESQNLVSARVPSHFKHSLPFAQGAGIRSSDGSDRSVSLYRLSHSALRDGQRTFMRLQIQASCGFTKTSTCEERLKTNQNITLFSPGSCRCAVWYKVMKVSVVYFVSIFIIQTMFL